MTTPARRQYLEIKSQYPDAILLYQIGDFFETFDEDAHIAARELQIVLTARSYGPGERVPLAGVPVHALDTYAARLVARGRKVAICEQVSPPGRGLVRREVTRVLTPGTVVAPGMVPLARDNYLAAVAFAPAKGGKPAGGALAYVDAATGAFGCTQWDSEAFADELQSELHRLEPAEVLVAEVATPPSATARLPELLALERCTLTQCPAHYFDPETARARLCRHFKTPSLAAFGCADQPQAVAAAGAILAYLERMNPMLLRMLTELRSYQTTGFVEIDGRTWRALEVIHPAHAAGTAQNGQRPPTLLATLDATRTAMGARLLRRTLLQPLHDRLTLEARLDALEELHDDRSCREHAASALDGLPDLERLTARVVHGSATAREVFALAGGLARASELRLALRECEAPALVALRASLDDCPDVRELVGRALADPDADDGRVIRAGYHAELDGMVAAAGEARRWIAALEGSERERTGIKSLKVSYNKVFGYSIEVTRPNLERVPADYQRRQTLAHGERFVTAALKEHEALVLHAEEQVAALERARYLDVLARIAEQQSRLRATAAACAQADVWLALATVAAIRGYVRPALTDGTELEITGGRHAILETTLDGEEFIPNDTRLDGLEAASPAARMLLLTGPNMAGKSTYLRQVATIVLLAQIGSFVPARHARVGLVDRIFTRVGAEDDLARGLSTFMLEMVETAYILRHATARSLVVLDEVGRGTSTHDGLAIARAVTEHLHTTVGARTLFATHFHELAALADDLPYLRVFRMEVADDDGRAIFLHRVVPGAGTRSYGVQVARMAGLPPTVTARAEALLSPVALAPAHASVAETRQDYAMRQAGGENGVAQLGDDELALALASLNLAAMTPIEALNVLFSLQTRALAALQSQRS
jgi:DNA mismatch repair protein MutS